MQLTKTGICELETPIWEVGPKDLVMGGFNDNVVVILEIWQPGNLRKQADQPGLHISGAKASNGIRHVRSPKLEKLGIPQRSADEASFGCFQ